MDLAEGKSLFDACVADPGNEAIPLVYADWLKENGQEELSRLTRLPWAISTKDPRRDVLAKDTNSPIRSFVKFARRLFVEAAYKDDTHPDMLSCGGTLFIDRQQVLALASCEEVNEIYRNSGMSTLIDPPSDRSSGWWWGMPYRFYGVSCIVADAYIRFDGWWFLTQYERHLQFWNTILSSEKSECP